MNERPTLNQLESDACHETGQFNAVQRYREMLAAHGYVIVHPDDVPDAAAIVIVHPDDVPIMRRADEGGYTTNWLDGWNDCRARIFSERSET